MFEIAGTCRGKTSQKMTLDLKNDMFFLLKPFLGCSKTKSIRYRLSDAQLSKNCCSFNDLPTVPLGGCGQKSMTRFSLQPIQQFFQDDLTQLWKITIFTGKIHYFYGHFQQLFVCLPEGRVGDITYSLIYPTLLYAHITLSHDIPNHFPPKNPYSLVKSLLLVGQIAAMFWCYPTSLYQTHIKSLLDAYMYVYVYVNVYVYVYVNVYVYIIIYILQINL